MPRAREIIAVVTLASSLGGTTASMPIASAASVQADAQPTTDRMPVPASLQVPLLLKILTYDRNFTARTGSSLRIAVVFNGTNQVSLRARDEIAAAFDAFGDKTVKNLPIRYTALEYVSDSQVDGAVRTGQINVFYVA